MNKLPIEDSPELLQGYGRAFAWLNMVEYELNMILLLKGGLGKANIQITTHLLDNMMFGPKIKLSEFILDSKTVKGLWKLNEKRVILAHGIVTERVVRDNHQILKTGDIIMHHKQKQTFLSEEFFEEIVQSSHEVSEKLRQELIKK